MHVGLNIQTLSCQPLKSFGKAECSPKNNSVNNPAFAASTVSREEYDKLNAKYDLACRIACAQAQQYNQLVAKYKAITK